MARDNAPRVPFSMDPSYTTGFLSIIKTALQFDEALTIFKNDGRTLLVHRRAYDAKAWQQLCALIRLSAHGSSLAPCCSSSTGRISRGSAGGVVMGIHSRPRNAAKTVRAKTVNQ